MCCSCKGNSGEVQDTDKLRIWMKICLDAAGTIQILMVAVTDDEDNATEMCCP